MKPIMGNYSGCFVFMFGSFNARFINIRSWILYKLLTVFNPFDAITAGEKPIALFDF